MSQGVYYKKITSLTFNEDFSTMAEFDKFMDMNAPELQAFRPILLSNGWFIDDDNSSAQTGLKLHTLNIPGITVSSGFPPQIIDKTYYAWVYDNVNEDFYLTTYIFKADKLTEVFYKDDTFTDYIRLFEYPVSGAAFDSSKQTLTLSVQYDEDQFIIPSQQQGRFRGKFKTVIFNQNFDTFKESDRFLDMYLPEINAFKPLMEALNWTYSEDDLWVEFSWLGSEDSFGLTIPEKPSLEDEIDVSSKLQLSLIHI